MHHICLVYPCRVKLLLTSDAKHKLLGELILFVINKYLCLKLFLDHTFAFRISIRKFYCNFIDFWCYTRLEAQTSTFFGYIQITFCEFINLTESWFYFSLVCKIIYQKANLLHQNWFLKQFFFTISNEEICKYLLKFPFRSPRVIKNENISDEIEFKTHVFLSKLLFWRGLYNF